MMLGHIHCIVKLTYRESGPAFIERSTDERMPAPLQDKTAI